MSLKNIVFALISALLLQGTQAQIIPKPLAVISTGKSFKIKNNSFNVVLPAQWNNEEAMLTYFTELLGDVGCSIQKNASKKSTELQILIDPAFSAEQYQLRIGDEKKITIVCSEKSGCIHAMISLQQLISAQVMGNSSKSTVKLAVQTIDDKPRMAYRGMHLDVCRHFFPVSFIKQYINMMAYYKFNNFHWHLTEDQGWRIEIKKYPKLTQIGGYRNGSQIGAWSAQTFDTFRYGGFYTQDEIKAVVAYAKARGINVIPEIEMPGHSLAALSAYPEFSCTGGPFTPAKGWGVFDDVYCAGNDRTFEFLQDVIDEVIELFPESPYIHIGGDECPKTRWKTCAKCQLRMKENGLKDEHELQSYFIQRMEKYINAKGKKIIGWDEILEGGLAPNATVMSWRGTAGGIEAAKQNHPAIMTPGKPCYFDHYQGAKEGEPVAIGGYNPLDTVYRYSPIPTDLAPTLKSKILGAQGNVWTEYMPNEEQVEYMVLPRAAALAEVLWSPEGTNTENGFDAAYTNFLNRCQLHQFQWKKWDWNYRAKVWQINVLETE